MAPRTKLQQTHRETSRYAFHASANLILSSIIKVAPLAPEWSKCDSCDEVDDEWALVLKADPKSDIFGTIGFAYVAFSKFVTVNGAELVSGASDVVGAAGGINGVGGLLSMFSSFVSGLFCFLDGMAYFA